MPSFFHIAPVSKVAAVLLPLMLASACSTSKLKGDEKCASTDSKDAGPNSNNSTAQTSPSSGSSAGDGPGGGAGNGNGNGAGNGAGNGSASGGLGGLVGGLGSIFASLTGGCKKDPVSKSASLIPAGAANLDDPVLTIQQRAVAQCLKSWGNSPFTTASPFRTIAASVSVFGAGTAVDDETVTKDPALIVIDAAVNVLGTPTYKLLNPNGWYCVVADVNVLSTVNFVLKSGAHLSSTGVGVNVLGSTDGTAGATDVNVLSCEKVTVVP